MKKIMFDDKYYLNEAVLDKTKTMTRRFANKILIENENQELVWNGKFKAPKYKVGEVVAIAQSYYSVYNERLIDGSFYKWCAENGLDHVEEIHKMEELKKEKGYDNKMFVKAELMPHQIQITDVKLEKLNDISDEECLMEGVRVNSLQDGNIYEILVRDKKYMRVGRHYPTPKEAFGGLINMMCGKNTWENNPWVYAYSFKLIK